MANIHLFHTHPCGSSWKCTTRKPARIPLSVVCRGNEQVSADADERKTKSKSLLASMRLESSLEKAFVEEVAKKSMKKLVKFLIKIVKFLIKIVQRLAPTHHGFVGGLLAAVLITIWFSKKKEKEAESTKKVDVVATPPPLPNKIVEDLIVIEKDLMKEATIVEKKNESHQGDQESFRDG